MRDQVSRDADRGKLPVLVSWGHHRRRLHKANPRCWRSDNQPSAVTEEMALALNMTISAAHDVFDDVLGVAVDIE